MENSLSQGQAVVFAEDEESRILCRADISRTQRFAAVRRKRRETFGPASLTLF